MKNPATLVSGTSISGRHGNAARRGEKDVLRPSGREDNYGNLRRYLAYFNGGA
jgi:hypothetical protein